MLRHNYPPDLWSLDIVVAGSPAVALEAEGGTEGGAQELQADITHHHQLAISVIVTWGIIS